MIGVVVIPLSLLIIGLARDIPITSSRYFSARRLKTSADSLATIAEVSHSIQVEEMMLVQSMKDDVLANDVRQRLPVCIYFDCHLYLGLIHSYL